MVRINLLPIREILRKRELKQFGLLSAGVIVGVIVLMVAVYLFYDFRIRSLEAEKRAHEAELTDLKAKNKEIDELTNKITRLKKQVDTIEKLTQKRDTPGPFMMALGKTIPDEVWLSAISKQGRSFALDGIGVDNTVVVNFVQRLQDLRQDFEKKNPTGERFFSDVKLVQIVAAGSQTGSTSLGAMSFKIVGNIRY